MVAELRLDRPVHFPNLKIFSKHDCVKFWNHHTRLEVSKCASSRFRRTAAVLPGHISEFFTVLFDALLQLLGKGLRVDQNVAGAR